MPKVVGEAKHLFAVEESENNIDWTIVFIRKTSAAGELKFKEYRNESLSRYIKLTRFDRGPCMMTNETEARTDPKKHSR